MAVNNLNKRVAYGLSDPLLVGAPLPIVSQRAPTGNDKAEIGTEWIDQPNNAVYILTSIVANVANWEAVGGGSLNIETLTGNSGGAIAPVAGNIDILGTQGEVFTGTAGTLTASFQRLELGTSAARLAPATGFSSNGNTLQAYSATTGGVAASSYTASLGDLSFVTGNGSGTGLGGSFALTVSTAGNIAVGAGSKSLATHADGGVVATTFVGALNSVVVNEAGAGDQAQTNIGGVLGQLSFGVGAANPTATNVAAIIADVALDPQSDTRAHGFVATRSGAGAGVAAGAAFKVINFGAVDNWSFGLDLYNGSAQDYGTADLRFWNQSFAVSSAGNVTFSALAATDWIFKLGDAVGANSFLVHASNNALVFTVQSDGTVLATNNIQIAGAGKGVIFPGGPAIVSGTGSPDTVVVAAKGSLYLRTDGGGINDRAYINTDGNNAWTAIVTVA